MPQKMLRGFCIPQRAVLCTLPSIFEYSHPIRPRRNNPRLSHFQAILHLRLHPATGRMTSKWKVAAEEFWIQRLVLWGWNMSKHPLHANVSPRLRPLPERPRESLLKISAEIYHWSSHRKESSLLWRLARSEVFIISQPPLHPWMRSLHYPTSRMPRRQVQMLAIGLQSAIHNRLQCLVSNPLQLRTHHFILPSHALYRPRLVVHMSPFTWVFHTTKLILATSVDLTRPISYSVPLSQPCSIPAPSPDAHPRKPSTSENEITAVPGEVEQKGAEVASPTKGCSDA